MNSSPANNPPTKTGPVSSYLIAADRVVDGKGHVIDGGAVVVVDGKIARVGLRAEIEAPPDIEVLDMVGCTVLPGLIDAHIHLGAQNVLQLR